MLKRDVNTTAHSIDELSVANKNKFNSLKNEIQDAFGLAMAKTDLSDFTALRDQSVKS